VNHLNLLYLTEFLSELEMFQTKVVQKIKTHILCSMYCFRKLWRLWGNGEKCGRARQVTDDNIIRRMRFACWVTKATDTLRTCNTYCFSTATLITRTHLKVHVVRTLPVLLHSPEEGNSFRSVVWCCVL
jgi:hypothetical protein